MRVRYSSRLVGEVLLHAELGEAAIVVEELEGVELERVVPGRGRTEAAVRVNDRRLMVMVSDGDGV